MEANSNHSVGPLSDLFSYDIFVERTLFGEAHAFVIFVLVLILVLLVFLIFVLLLVLMLLGLLWSGLLSYQSLFNLDTFLLLLILLLMLLLLLVERWLLVDVAVFANIFIV